MDYIPTYQLTMMKPSSSSMKRILHSTVYASLLVQIVTGVSDFLIYFLPVLPQYAVLKSLLAVEIFVQIIEGTFYVWLAHSFSYLDNVTPNRYFDWVITTPSMLYTVCIYMDYLRFTESNKKNDDNNDDEDNDVEANRNTDRKIYDLSSATRKHQQSLIVILLLNWLMLLFGYLAERNVLATPLAVSLGFLPFLAYFTILYFQFAQYTMGGQILFWFFFLIWSVYGIAALLPYYWKNISYNMLDLVAKNFFGVFLAYVVYQAHLQSISIG